MTHDIDALENVQIKAVNMISGLKGKSYQEKLKELNMQSLETRRKRFDIIQVYKIMNSLVDMNSNQWFERLLAR